MNASWLLDHLGGTVAPYDTAPMGPRLALVAAALGLCLAIAAIDARHRIIPDRANAALAGAGLLSAALGGAEDVIAAALQGVVAFALFWAFRRLYRLLRGIQGLGFGDVKFMGAAGIWVGLGGLAPLLLLACVAALGYVAWAHLRGDAITGRTALPFGPFLAFGLAVVLIGSLLGFSSS